MEQANSFKYDLSPNCPQIFIKKRGLHESEYSIFYFRVTKNSPPNDKDFVPQLFLSEFDWRKKKLEKEEKFAELCQMASISILPSESEANRLMRKFKNIGKYIYKGIVSKKDGLLLGSPSFHFPNHCSFYSYAEINEQNIFAERC